MLNRATKKFWRFLDCGWEVTEPERQKGSNKGMHKVSSSSSSEGYPLQVRHKQDRGRGFIFLLPHTAAQLESDAGSGVIKPASRFVIQNRQTLCSIGHAVRAWSSVCSEAPHSQFDEGAKPHLCMYKWNRPTPVRRRLSLPQTA